MMSMTMSILSYVHHSVQWYMSSVMLEDDEVKEDRTVFLLFAICLLMLFFMLGKGDRYGIKGRV